MEDSFEEKPSYSITIDSDNDDEAKSSSSESEQSTAVDIKSAEIKLQQMRRVARKKRGDGNKLKGLQSYETVMKAQALRRMQEGLARLLGLHTPVELSSICGCLRLKPQQKASHSIEQIMRFASAQEEMIEEKTKSILSFMWEGALWEYLHSIGHPVHNMRLDPRDTIYEIWKKGGMLESQSIFVPHFISREVKKRNEWIQSDDVQKRLEALQEAQDKAKIAERKVISEHDYTNILQYFNMMSSLRRLETDVREYLISELEISRSRIDSLQDQARLLRAQLGENEKQFITVTEQLNTKLAHAEFTRDRAVRDRINMESLIFRVNGILDSYIDAEKNREELHGGTMQAQKLRQVETLPTCIQQLSGKLQQFRQQRDVADDALRSRARCHIHQIDQLNRRMAEMDVEYKAMVDQHAHAVGAYNALLQNYVLSERKMKRLEERVEYNVQSGWRTSANLAGEVLEYKQRIHRVKPVLTAGLVHSQSSVVTLSWALISALQLAPTAQEYAQLENNMLMKQEDVRSFQFEVQERARMAVLQSSPKSKKKGVASGKKGTSSSSGKGSPSKSSSKNSNKLEERSVASTSSAGTSSKKNAGNNSNNSSGLQLKKPGSSAAGSRKVSPSPSKPSTPSVPSPAGKRPPAAATASNNSNKSPAKKK